MSASVAGLLSMIMPRGRPNGVTRFESYSMKKMNLILAALFLGAAIAQADEIVILENRANDFDTWGMRPDGRERVLNAISRETGVPITTLEAQRDSTRLGHGGLFIANQFFAGTPCSASSCVRRSARACSYAFFNSSLCQVIVAAARSFSRYFCVSPRRFSSAILSLMS